MERTITETVDIAAEPQEVWEVLVDVERWHEWTPSIRRVRLLDGALKLAPGARAQVKQPGMPAMAWAVTSYDEGRSFSWSSANPGLRTVGDHRVEAQATGARVTLRIVQSGPLAGVAAAVYGRRSRTFVRAEAAGLRVRVEERTAPRRS